MIKLRNFGFLAVQTNLDLDEFWGSENNKLTGQFELLYDWKGGIANLSSMGMGIDKSFSNEFNKIKVDLLNDYYFKVKKSKKAAKI